MRFKYYFGLKNSELFLDSVETDSDNPPEPEHFLKWYEEGDLKKVSSGSSGVPLFGVLRDWEISFSITEALQKRSSHASK